MSRNYLPLPASQLSAAAGIHQPPHSVAPTVGLDDPAETVMTDFRKVRALVVLDHVTMDAAYRRMQSQHVRLLLVVDEGHRVVGLVTSTDIEGEKPLRVQQQRGIRRSEILVGDVMTARDRLEVMDMDDVRHAKVGHVVATLKAVGRQHALVVDSDRHGRQTIRGLFAASQVARQVGLPLETVEVARSFAQVEEMLAH